MQIIGAILGTIFYLNLILNIIVLAGSFFFATSIQGWQYGLLFSFAILMLILSSISIRGVKLIRVFPGDTGWAIISFLLILFLGGNWLLGGEYVNSLKGKKEAFFRDKAIENNISESQLESIDLLKDTPLYQRDKKKVIFKKKLSTSLTVRVYPETVDIGGVIYREVVFPRKDTDASDKYLENVWDSESEKYLIEVISLNEASRKKTKAETKKAEEEAIKSAAVAKIKANQLAEEVAKTEALEKARLEFERKEAEKNALKQNLSANQQQQPESNQPVIIAPKSLATVFPATLQIIGGKQHFETIEVLRGKYRVSPADTEINLGEGWKVRNGGGFEITNSRQTVGVLSPTGNTNITIYKEG